MKRRSNNENIVSWLSLLISVVVTATSSMSPVNTLGSDIATIPSFSNFQCVTPQVRAQDNSSTVHTAHKHILGICRT